jgi:hypothetical protein
MNKNYLYIGLMFILLIGIGNVSGAECNAGGLVQCTMTASLTLNGSNYTFGDSTFIGQIRLTASNIILDCNNSKLMANDSTGLNLYATNINNITIKNCNLEARSEFNQSAGWTNTGSNIWRYNLTYTPSYYRIWLNNTEYAIASSNTTVNSSNRWFRSNR